MPLRVPEAFLEARSLLSSRLYRQMEKARRMRQ
jgi:hypothetical protein